MERISNHIRIVIWNAMPMHTLTSMAISSAFSGDLSTPFVKEAPGVCYKIKKILIYNGFHCGDKTIERLFHIQNMIFYVGMSAFLSMEYSDLRKHPTHT